MYEFSIPMLYDKELIDRLCELNNSLTKSKITTFYDALPENSDFLTGLEQSRGPNMKVNNLNDFLDNVKYAKDKGFNFIYLFNTTSAINMSNHIEYKKVTNNIDVIVRKLRDIGCNRFRVGNTSTIQYLCETYPDIEIAASTVLGYTGIEQYKNIVEFYPNIKEICLHYDNNRNIKLLKNLAKHFPDIKKEVMVNELCIKGCPLRNSHYSILYPQFSSFSDFNTQRLFMHNCGEYTFKDFWLYICKSNMIYPWNIKTYAENGINYFKFIGRFYDPEAVKVIYEYIFNYLKSIEDEEIMNETDFFSFYNLKYCTNFSGLKVKDVKEYLPDINHFAKSGHLCDSICEMECNYCYEKAKVLNELFPLDNYDKGMRR